MLPVYIGIDVGTQGTKAIAYHPSSRTTEDGSDVVMTGTILARASKGYDVLPPLTVEQSKILQIGSMP